MTLLETCRSALVSAQISGLHLCPDKSLPLADNSREGGVLHYDAKTDSVRKLVSCGSDECHSVYDVLCETIRFGIFYRQHPTKSHGVWQ